ncbi:arginine--tRNA ligase [Spirochaetia bacterium]|nr:arginine--tRNA ligase [Spirochaetia bacterium]
MVMIMKILKELWKSRIAAVLHQLSAEIGPVILEIPPRPEMGDFAFPMFTYAKVLKKAPVQIASLLVSQLNTPEAAAEGPYINIRLNREESAPLILSRIFDPAFCRPEPLAGSKYMVEFSSPNTNKPLHLGHLRNDVLGESLSRILAACGAEVRKVCIINDRGIHICKSMLAYQEQGAGQTPESTGKKSDHFVGDFYVLFNRLYQQELEKLQGTGLTEKEAEARSTVLNRAQEMLRKWEAGDPETVELWKKMNQWTISGMKETYSRTGISFDHYYFESQTYLTGKDEILRGLEQGIFYRADDGSVWVDLTGENLDKKALLRKDGTSLYITQDIGTAIFRHRDWNFDRLVYVVGSEQQYHFKVLFSVLQKLGFSWAEDLYHLSYGMVNLPDGKMKSREGTVVDADDLIDSLAADALQEIHSKDREDAVGDSAITAEKIALGALHYYLLQFSPAKDMLFDPKESLSFTGNTGPYLQYMGARISSMIRKAGSAAESGSGVHLTGDAEWELLKSLSSYPQVLTDAAQSLDPSRIATYLHELSQLFSRFYHDCPVLTADDPAVVRDRFALSSAALRILQDALSLICVPFLEIM